uniref:Uncharacterized protein n=1 Tax=Leersia perrieri TaxID=77586 RepID=A0A0D9VWB1_9ORYZ
MEEGLPFPANIEAMRRTPQFKLIQAVFHGDLRAFKRQAKVLDVGRGRLRKAVEEVRVEGVPGEEGVGVLQLAASQGNIEICKYLIDIIKVDVDDADDKGKTSLFNTVTSGHREVAKYLLDHGANPDQAMRCGLSPLHVAAGLGDCESVKVLLAKGAYVDPISIFGTPLHLAAKEGKDGTMKILLDHNADCNKMVNGMTPFLLATKAASAKYMELLVEAGADGTLSDVFLNCMSTAFMDDGDSVSSDSEPEEAGANHHVPVNAVQPRCWEEAVAHDMGRRHVQHRRKRSGWWVGTGGARRRELGLDFIRWADGLDNPVNRRKIIEFKSLGLGAVEKKDYRSAAGFYSKAMELDPDDATLLSNRSLCWLYMGDGGKALLDAHEYRKKGPDWSKACYRQGTALMLLKDYASACEPLLDGFKLDPGNIEIENALRIWKASGIHNGSFGVLEDISKHLTQLYGFSWQNMLRVYISLLDKGRGCLRDSVMAARIGRSAGRCTSPLAASHGSMEVCMYLVERHKVDVNDIDMEEKIRPYSVMKYIQDNFEGWLTCLQKGGSKVRLQVRSLLLMKMKREDLENTSYLAYPNPVPPLIFPLSSTDQSSPRAMEDDLPFPANIEAMHNTPQFKLAQAVFNGDLRGFKRQAKVLDMGRGRLRKAVEEVRVEGVPGEEGVGMLQLAASQGHMEICKYLVDTLKVDVDDADDEGKTPLLKAVHSGHQGIAKYLLDHGANPDQAMRCGLAPLHSAARLRDCESVKQLLAKGAYVDPVRTHGTPLHLAALEGQDGTMKILLDHNADFNKIVNGITPLLLATRSASAKCMELLVEAGADRTLSDAFVNYMSTAFVDDGDGGSSDSELEEAGANHHVSVNGSFGVLEGIAKHVHVLPFRKATWIWTRMSGGKMNQGGVRSKEGGERCKEWMRISTGTAMGKKDISSRS